MNHNVTTAVHLRLPKEVVDTLLGVADYRGSNLSQVIREVLLNHVRALKAEKGE